jgi:acyl carrier protein
MYLTSTSHPGYLSLLIMVCDTGGGGTSTVSKSSSTNRKRGGKVSANAETTPEQEREALTLRLKDEVARLLDASPIEMNASSPLSELGLDSMGLTQLRGILQTKFHVVVEEPELFDEGMTLSKLVLRIQNKDNVTGADSTTANAPRSAAGADADASLLVSNKKGCCTCF